MAPQPMLQMDEEEQCADITEFVDVLRDATTQHGNTRTMAALTTDVGRIKKIKKSNMLNCMLFSLGQEVCTAGAGRGKIPCQPASIARRPKGKPRGKPRGAAPLGKGRKRKQLTANVRSKRPRNLSENVAKNLANATSHGSGH